jgi:hypothetical protein
LLLFYLPATAFLEEMVPAKPIRPLNIETTAKRILQERITSYAYFNNMPVACKK